MHKGIQNFKVFQGQNSWLWQRRSSCPVTYIYRCAIEKLNSWVNGIIVHFRIRNFPVWTVVFCQFQRFKRKLIFCCLLPCFIVMKNLLCIKPQINHSEPKRYPLKLFKIPFKPPCFSFTSSTFISSDGSLFSIKAWISISLVYCSFLPTKFMHSWMSLLSNSDISLETIKTLSRLSFGDSYYKLTICGAGLISGLGRCLYWGISTLILIGVWKLKRILSIGWSWPCFYSQI